MRKDIKKKQTGKIDYQFSIDIIEQTENKCEVLNYQDEQEINQCFFENGYGFDENKIIKIEKLF